MRGNAAAGRLMRQFDGAGNVDRHTVDARSNEVSGAPVQPRIGGDDRTGFRSGNHTDPKTYYGSLSSHVVAGTAVGIPPQRGVVEGVDHLAYDQLRFTRNLDDSGPVDEGADRPICALCVDGRRDGPVLPDRSVLHSNSGGELTVAADAVAAVTIVEPGDLSSTVRSRGRLAGEPDDGLRCRRWRQVVVNRAVGLNKCDAAADEFDRVCGRTVVNPATACEDIGVRKPRTVFQNGQIGRASCRERV